MGVTMLTMGGPNVHFREIVQTIGQLHPLGADRHTGRFLSQGSMFLIERTPWRANVGQFFHQLGQRFAKFGRHLFVSYGSVFQHIMQVSRSQCHGILHAILTQQVGHRFGMTIIRAAIVPRLSMMGLHTITMGFFNQFCIIHLQLPLF